MNDVHEGHDEGHITIETEKHNEIKITHLHP